MLRTLDLHSSSGRHIGFLQRFHNAHAGTTAQSRTNWYSCDRSYSSSSSSSSSSSGSSTSSSTPPPSSPPPQPTVLARLGLASRSGFLAILGIGVLSAIDCATEPCQLLKLLAPMGASACLVFAAPAAPFSQPKNVILGHLLSGFIGACIGQMVVGERQEPAGVKKNTNSGGADTANVSEKAVAKCAEGEKMSNSFFSCNTIRGTCAHLAQKMDTFLRDTVLTTILPSDKTVSKTLISLVDDPNTKDEEEGLDIHVAVPLGCGLAIASMQFLGVMHPPAGAMAIIMTQESAHHHGHFHDSLMAMVRVVFGATVLVGLGKLNPLLFRVKYPAA